VCVVCVSVLKVSGWVGVMCVSDTSTHPHTHPHTHTHTKNVRAPTHPHTHTDRIPRTQTHTHIAWCVCVCVWNAMCVCVECDVCVHENFDLVGFWALNFARSQGFIFSNRQHTICGWMMSRKLMSKAIFTVAETLSNLTLFHETVKIGAASIFFHIYTNRQDCKLILTIKVSRLRNTGA